MSRYLFALLALLLFFGDTPRSAQAQRRPAPPPDSLDVERVRVILRRVEREQREQAAAWAARHGLPASKHRPDGRRVQLVGIEAGRPIYLTSLNRESAEYTKTVQLYPGQGLGLTLTGQDMEMGIWDGGVPLETHQEFGGRVLIKNRVAADDHASHVAGTLVASGLRPDAQGMAFEARLRAYDWDDDATEMGNEGARGLLVSNHSYGMIAGWYYGDLESQGDQWYWLGDPSVSEVEDYVFGWYDVEAAQFDRVVYTNPYLLPIVAAGNDRGDDGPASGSYRALNRQGSWQTFSVGSNPHPRDGGSEGYDTIAGASVAKNVLTVGSVRFTSFDQPEVSSFSSFGPTDDGRIKPDLVGFGERVVSSTASGPTAYGISSGTSMATPNIAGTLLLLQQHARNLTGHALRASTLKGLALHTARDVGPAGPDYQHGWGLLDAEAAARQVTASLADPLALEEAALQNGTPYTRYVTVDEAGPLRLTISWTDAPSSRLPVRSGTSLDDATPHLLNDLDLRLINDATGETYLPFTLDPVHPSRAAVPGDNVVDPVEQIYLARVAAGTYTIIVSHKGNLVSAKPQPFALIVTGAQNTVRPVAVSHLEAREQTVERVLLAWKTQFERSPGTFQVRRAPLTYFSNGAREVGAFELVGEVLVEGSSEQPRDYAFEDQRLPAGRFLYRLFFEGEGAPFLASEVEVNVPAPEHLAILSNYPNPFRDRTSVVVDLPEPQEITMDVYDLLGRRVEHVFSGALQAGRHEMVITATGWAPGLYFARLVTPRGTQTHRMVVIQ